MMQSLRFGWFTHKEQRQVARSFTDKGFNPSARVLVRELERPALRPAGTDAISTTTKPKQRDLAHRS
jgi:hypothetical protein